ncbi:hypothetical protein CO174_00250 [Candidatus Uhrbacteria bacterium CG_4_9_14_3_um_filter_50_9]|uniref:Nudix hydrolase domain-containing protein n=1 Tax=Candidatus Uhrbacteria bacterium CG_4_9_14_3_um_filter_50_9 TaxID=1975035 RepID=A0A2M7XEY6_9BACT|nr:MAG: hypothetical protein CO174_00250 [Candidatus Uhrbacteria bacterium CG_4_9_14_3_um_filter_50_9]
MPNYEKFMISQVGVWVKDGKVLILEDASKPGLYVIPGGRIDEQEEAEVAFARELKEEIGMDVFEKGEHLMTYPWYAGERKVPYCAVAYRITSDHADIQLSFEHLQYKWITQEEINDYNYIWPCTAEMLRKGFERKEI